MTAKILVVEDENIVAKDIQLRLKALGYEVCGVASTGHDAVDMALKFKPDLILMDIMLKGDIDGIQTSEKIKEHLNVPVIFITAYGDEYTLQRAKITEPFGYVLKPFEERELHINIEIALYKHKSEKKIAQSEKWLQKTLESIVDSVITTDINGLITYMNKNSQNLLDYSFEEVVKKQLSDVFQLYCEENELNINDILKKVINNGERFNFENGVYLQNTKIKQLFINVKISPINDVDNNIIGAVIIYNDITEKKKASDILSLIIENTSSMIGEDFFNSLVKQLAKTLNVPFAFICELKNINEKVSRVISSWEVNKYGENIEFNMINTPSEKVLLGKMVFYPEKIQHLFPEDNLLKNFDLESYIGLPILDSNSNVIGHLGVMHNKPIIEDSIHETILKFISQRTSIELMRKRGEEALKKSEEKYKNLTNSLPHIIFETDKDFKFSFVNKYAIQSLEYPKNELLGNVSVYDIFVPEEREKLKESINKVLNGEDVSFSEYHAIKKDLTAFPVILYLNPLLSNENIVSGLRGIIIDVSELRKTENALRESEERYNLTLKGINDGFWDWNINTNEMYFSSRWKYMLGYDDNDINNTPDDWFSKVHHDDIEKLRENVYLYTNNSLNNFEYEYRILTKEGKYKWVLCRGNAVRDSKGDIYRIFGSQTDIEKHKLNEKLLEKLLHNVSHDHLTGLPNRSLFMERLEKAIVNSKRGKDYKFAVLFIDIDRFKVINDSLGHSTGNSLLIEAAIKLQLCVRPEDTIARLGSDEFTILIEDLHDAGDALRVAKRIQKDLSTPFILNGHEVFTSASIGIALSSGAYEEPEEIIRDADIAMRKAKTFGRSRYELFDSDMHVHALELLQIETDLRYAIERNEFILHYQPIISLKTGKITGFEALIRWIHPKKGLIGSDIFIPIAEETGMIIPIGKWVLKEACSQIKIWHELFDNKNLTMSINISGKQFSHPKLIEQIEQIINDSEIDPSCIKLEITESTIMENAETARSMLERIRELDIQLQIDDFGTGYSSLSYLHRFPVNSLKVDRSFVSRIGSNDENVEIVKTIVALAKNLNMEAVAEGIETLEQLEQLKSLDCEYGQGYYFSKPVNTDVIESLLRRKPVW